MEEVSSCTVAQAFCKKSFDHKPIFLNFKKIRKRGRKCLNNRVIDNPLLEGAVKLAIWETYLKEFVFEAGGIDDAVFREECLKLSSIEEKHNSLICLRGIAVTRDLDEEEMGREQLLAADIDREWENVIPYDNLQLLPRNIDDDLFFELLITNTSQAAFRIQNMAFNAEQMECNNLYDRFKIIKRNI